MKKLIVWRLNCPFPLQMNLSGNYETYLNTGYIQALCKSEKMRPHAFYSVTVHGTDSENTLLSLLKCIIALSL